MESGFARARISDAAVPGLGEGKMSVFSSAIERGVKEGVTEGLMSWLPQAMADLIKEYTLPLFAEIDRLRAENESLLLRVCIRDRGYCCCEACKGPQTAPDGRAEHAGGNAAGIRGGEPTK